MCRALKVLCAAEGRERLAVLKRASVGARWELVGGALIVLGVAVGEAGAALRARARRPAEPV